jgi:hypothetical protein
MMLYKFYGKTLRCLSTATRFPKHKELFADDYYDNQEE